VPKFMNSGGEIGVFEGADKSLTVLELREGALVCLKELVVYDVYDVLWLDIFRNDIVLATTFVVDLDFLRLPCVLRNKSIVA
jgi:hypothetical protein